MLAVKGTYKEGQVSLKEPVPFEGTVEVIVTFLEEPPVERPQQALHPSQFSFARAQRATQAYPTSLSDTLLEERRN